IPDRTMATISSEVATGRMMNGRDGLIVVASARMGVQRPTIDATAASTYSVVVLAGVRVPCLGCGVPLPGVLPGATAGAAAEDAAGVAPPAWPRARISDAS